MCPALSFTMKAGVHFLDRPRRGKGEGRGYWLTDLWVDLWERLRVYLLGFSDQGVSHNADFNIFVI